MIRNLLFHPKAWDKVAITEEGKDFTYSDLLAKACAFSGRLPFDKSENIAILLPNSADFVCALFGVFMAGMTAFPLNTQLTAHEITELLTKANVRAVITSLEYAHLLSGAAGGSHPSLQIIIAQELVANENAEAPAAKCVGANEPMVLLSTSGTTGNAKIVQLSEQNMLTTVTAFAAYNAYEKFDEDRIKYILGTPFASVYGLLILSTCLMKSFPIVIPKETVTLDVLYAMAQAHQVSHYEGGAAIPLLMDQMAGRPISYDISSLKFIGYGGSKVSADVLRRLSASFPDIHVCTGYGMTESASLITRPYKALPGDKLDSVGIPIPDVTVMVDSEGTLTNTPRVIGEVVAKGPNIMLGYYENEEETRSILKDGYLYTGDIGYFDEDGYLYLCGRKKNVIMVRGFSVYAEEVEACLINSGLISDCIVYGQTDASGNEMLCADIVLSGAQVQINQIRSYCEDHLAAYKRPQRLKLVETIKKTATGKSERTDKSEK